MFAIFEIKLSLFEFTILCLLFNAKGRVSCLDETVEFHRNYLSTFQFLKSNSDIPLNIVQIPVTIVYAHSTVHATAID